MTMAASFSILKVVPSMWKLFFPQSDEVKAELVTRLCHGLDLLEAELKARRSKFFFSNTSAGLLDYHIWPWLERLPALHNVLRKIDIPWQKFPRMVIRLKSEPYI